MKNTRHRPTKAEPRTTPAAAAQSSRPLGGGRPREVAPGEGPEEVDPGSHPSEVERPARTPVAPEKPDPAPTPTSPPRVPRPDAPAPPTKRPPSAAHSALAVLLPLALVDESSTSFSWEAAKATLFDTLTGIWEASIRHLPFLVAGATVLAATAVAAFLLRRVAAQFLKRSSLRRSLRELFERLVVLAVWVGGLLTSAMVVFPGLTPTKALGGLGIASFAVGLAFKDIFENFFAGILILWRFPFDQGDYIACGPIMGRVEEITVRNTLIRQPTDELVVVPNSKLYSQPVEVLTHGDLRRVTMECGVAYESDLEDACNAIESALGNCESVAKDLAVQVFPRDFGDSSINIEVAWWTSPEPVALRSSRAEVVRAIKRALEEAQVEIPFPQRVLSFKTAEAREKVLDEAV